MEVILDELQTRGVDIDMRTLSHILLMICLSATRRCMYNQMVVNVNPNEMHVFNTINVTNFVRAMAYLTLVYFMHASEDTTRRAVRLFIFFFIYLALPTRAGSPQQHMPITVGPFCLTHPVNFPCGRKPEYPEETRDFRQSVGFYSFRMRTGFESH